jgi:hypothetical protein
MIYNAPTAIQIAPVNAGITCLIFSRTSQVASTNYAPPGGLPMIGSALSVVALCIPANADPATTMHIPACVLAASVSERPSARYHYGSMQVGRMDKYGVIGHGRLRRQRRLIPSDHQNLSPFSYSIICSPVLVIMNGLEQLTLTKHATETAATCTSVQSPNDALTRDSGRSQYGSKRIAVGRRYVVGPVPQLGYSQSRRPPECSTEAIR